MKPPRPVRRSSARRALAVAALAAAAGSGCVNSRLGEEARKLTSNLTPTATSSTTPTSGGDYFKIANVVLAAASGAAAGAPQVATIYIDPSQSAKGSGTGTPTLTQRCAPSGASGTHSKPCSCEYKWTEVNATTGTSVNVTRTVETPVTNVQQALITCNAPDVYATEVPDGASVKIRVVAGSGNSEIFSTSTYTHIRNNNAAAGSFRDAEGRAFDNIRHYACFEQFKRGKQILSKLGTETNNSTGEAVPYALGNQFCVQNASGTATEGCSHLDSNLSYSAQAYYYNFYIRSTESGDANTWNARYTCPLVKESLNNPAGSTGGQNSLWPMDTNFALSMGKSPDFPIGVDAFVELANGGSDPVASTSKSCNGSVPSGNGSTNGFVQGCLGFAAKPNSDGTCPYFRDSTGQIRLTYRLRRFIALYPPVFGVDGGLPANNQPSDTVYVLDRPVAGSSNALKPYTMRGPKPCPFALFDAKKVTGTAEAGYVSTNNPLWAGTNVDGIEFPNHDSPNSCSTSFPLVQADPFNPDLAILSLGTLNQNNPVLKRQFIRPIKPWAPHYEEDLEFQACAPQASPFRDPPLHFAKDPVNGNVAWCAESYPSQNHNVAALDRLQDASLPQSATNKFTGQVRPFTSHVVKQSASATCAATIPNPLPASGSTSLYPAANSVAADACNPTAGVPAALARHPGDLAVDRVFSYTTANPPVQSSRYACAPQTCDRTAVAVGGSSQWQHFPLLASPPYVEQAISSDSTYGCVITYDAGGAKKGKLTPREGCCGPAVHLNTGLSTASAPGAKEIQNMSAHLEPDVACQAPRYQ